LFKEELCVIDLHDYVIERAVEHTVWFHIILSLKYHVWKLNR